ncbi:MAG: lamin tail domain-containing protein, partial [Candidatus Nealsonbacteria bacterium]|nr:lamin tail domain-containing protein [Candidatus Nealsonbacteria bacterium]
EVLYRHNDPDGDAEHYWGGEFSWLTQGPGWVLVMDAAGNAVDFVVWGYSEVTTLTFNVEIDGHTFTIDDVWSGLPLAAAGTRDNSLQRSGSLDRDNAADWRFTNPGLNDPNGDEEPTVGETNVGLTVPFPAQAWEMPPGATTYYYRTEFQYDELPDLTELSLDVLVDDGAVFYLNGNEIYRHNMPAGAITYDTLASSDLVNPTFEFDIPVSTDGLVQGRNVLAVELHQSSVADPDNLFATKLNATVWPPAWLAVDKDLAFNEIASAGESSFWLELVNHGDTFTSIGGYAIVSSTGEEHVLAAQTLQPGEFLSLTQAELGFHPADEDSLTLLTPNRSMVVDAVRVKNSLRGRSPDGTGEWLWPYRETGDPANPFESLPTPGAANTFDFHDEIVINEIMYQHHPWTNDPAQPYRESTEEWIELYNRSDVEVDLGGWELDGGIGYDLLPGTTIAPGGYLVVAKDADTLRQKYPGIDIVGSYSRTLSNRGERILLVDPVGNPADEVHYHESGRWSLYADGGGSSLELRDPDADNAKAEAWAASDESDKSSWHTYTYRAVCQEPLSLGANLQHFILGLLDEGEFYLDDVSVRRDPDGANREVITNASFQGDTIGNAPSQWRLVGNHSGTVQPDPENPGNKVLHFVAAGPQQHIHDHVTTNFGNGETIRDGQEYEISLRAKWIAGSPQVNNRFYFTRMSNTFILEVPQDNGTPGAQNSTFEANVGPTYSDLVQFPVLPAADEPVTISVRAEDPDGVDRIELRWAVNEGSFRTETMTLDNDGLYKATIAGQSSNAVVQFYVRSWDTPGELSTFPAAGEDSRALYQVGTTAAPSQPIDTVRIIMLASDRSDLVVRYNEMSNMYFGASVVHTINYADGPVDVAYHDVEVRQIGSRFIRPNSGYKIRLRPDQKFYGVHGSIRLDMSLMGEIYMKHMVARAGGSGVSMYDDVARMIDPRHGTRTVLLQLARYEDTYLNEQFVDGNEGTKWELDDIVIPTSPVQMGYNNDQAITNQDIRDRGPNPESYRGHLLIKNQRYKDDYQKIADMAQAINLTGTELYNATNEIMDVDLWMRHYATQAFLGNWDTYGFGRPKNLRIYVRPEDGKIIPLFWDADRGNLSDSLIWNGNVSRLDDIRNIPQNTRLFWGHMWDLTNRSFNGDYMATWIPYYTGLGVGSPMHSANAINNRANTARNQARNAIPQVSFQLTTTLPLPVNDVGVTLEGKGWIDVREIRLAGSNDPLNVIWTGYDTWKLDVPLESGANVITLEAFDFEEQSIATDTITVTSSVPDRPLWESLRITEVNYEPAEPTTEEEALGFDDEEFFEFIELQNISTTETLDLTGVQVTEGIDYAFA